jgi:hypothetical protein
MRFLPIAGAGGRQVELREKSFAGFVASLTAWIVCVALVVALGGCTAHWGPDYDKSIYDGLNKVNEEALTLFASISEGTRREGFARREPAYNGLIGKIEALQVEVENRPAGRPSPISRFFGERKGDQPPPESGPVVPTQKILPLLRESFVDLRDTDRTKGLVPASVRGARSQFVIWINQALAYEKFLQR